MSLLSLSDAQIEHIRQVKPVFEKVERLTHVPWEAVAAVWYRESFSVAPPARPGGSFQFDPPLRSVRIQQLLNQFTQLSNEEINHHATKGVNDFETGALCAACWLRLQVPEVITPSVSDAVMKEAFYGYNGRAYGSSDKSPYVMNGYDAQHQNMRIKGTLPDGKGGRIQVSTIDKRPGVFTVYRQLKDVFHA